MPHPNHVYSIELIPGKPQRFVPPKAPQQAFLSFPLMYEGRHYAKLHLRFYARGEEAPSLDACYGFLPGGEYRFCFETRFLDGQTLFLPRYPGCLKITCLGNRIEWEEMSAWELELEDTGFAQQASIGEAEWSQRTPEFPLPQKPMIDSLGQRAEVTWPGKTADEAELVSRLQEAKRMAEAASSTSGKRPAIALAPMPTPTPTPTSYSRLGGDRSRSLEATGWFRTAKHEGKWYLVDPDGHPFFSTGMDCVRVGTEVAIVPGTEACYPGDLMNDARFSLLRGKRDNWGNVSFSLEKANLIRAFGDDWKQSWMEITEHRLQSWGFNTVACWSDPEFARYSALPYVAILKDFPKTEISLFRDLPDVFAPEYEAASREYALQLEEFVEDRRLIGYFLCNEPKWGFGDFNLASEILESHPGSHTRKALVRYLSERYHGDEVALKKAWGMEEAGFDALVRGEYHRTAQRHPGSSNDLWQFSHEIARKFAELPTAACREVDPNHLNLGMRFAWVSSDLCYTMGRLFDVFSLNCYQMLPDTASAEQVERRCGKPVVIGEYHFGALDRGLVGAGLRSVASQQERAVAYRRYFDACAAHPDVVGCHYFQLHDQPYLGRFDGENWQIGFLDVCHRAYPEIAAAARKSHESMYAVRAGRTAPFSRDAVEVRRLGH